MLEKLTISRNTKFPISSHVSTTLWQHHLDSNEVLEEKARWELLKDDACCFQQILEAAPSNNKNSCMATYFSSYKTSKWNEQYWLSTAGEVRMKSLATFSYGLLHNKILLCLEKGYNQTRWYLSGKEQSTRS